MEDDEWTKASLVDLNKSEDWEIQCSKEICHYRWSKGGGYACFHSEEKVCSYESCPLRQDESDHLLDDPHANCPLKGSPGRDYSIEDIESVLESLRERGLDLSHSDMVRILENIEKPPKQVEADGEEYQCFNCEETFTQDVIMYEGEFYCTIDCIVKKRTKTPPNNTTKEEGE